MSDKLYIPIKIRKDSDQTAKGMNSLIRINNVYNLVSTFHIIR